MYSIARICGYLLVLLLASAPATSITAHCLATCFESQDLSALPSAEELGDNEAAHTTLGETGKGGFVGVVFDASTSERVLAVKHHASDPTEARKATWDARSFASFVRRYSTDLLPGPIVSGPTGSPLRSDLARTDESVYGEDFDSSYAFLSKGNGMRSSNPLGTLVNLPARALLSQANGVRGGPSVLTRITSPIPLSLYAGVLVWVALVGGLIYFLSRRRQL